MGRNSKIGILGGTFDPIHQGHLRIAEEIHEEFDLGKVYFIPGAHPPHKKGLPITPFEDRFSMVKIAVQGSSFIEVLDLEGRRSGFSYTIETLKEIRKELIPTAELFFIIGMDAFFDIKTWKDYKQLFEYSDFILLDRPSFPRDGLGSFINSLELNFQQTDKNTFSNPSGNRIFYTKIPLMEISSTSIRDRIVQKRSIRFLVPESVRVYISQKRLYKFNENIG